MTSATNAVADAAATDEPRASRRADGTRKLTPILQHTYLLHKAPGACRHAPPRSRTDARKLVITVIDPDDATPEET